jgi:hypothetical protein
MRREDILAYVNRDWRAVAESKERFWAERKKRMTPAEAVAFADDWRAYVAQRRPDWPSSEERNADLATHARVSEMLRRAGPARR